MALLCQNALSVYNIIKNVFYKWLLNTEIYYNVYLNLSVNSNKMLS